MTNQNLLTIFIIFKPYLNPLCKFIYRMFNFDKILSTATGLLFSLSCYCQFENIQFKEISTDERISQSHVLCIYQDSKDFLWFGVYSGLYRYDGYNFVRYNVNLFENSGFIDYGVHAIFEDDEQQLWIGSENGLSVVNRITGNITHFNHDAEDKNSIGHDFIKSISKTATGEILVGTYGGGISLYNKQLRNFTTFTAKNSDTTSISSNLINAIYTDKEGIIWIGTEGGGVNIFDVENKTFRHFQDTSSDYFPDHTINSFLEDNNGNIWIGTWNNGLFRYNKNQNTITEYSTRSLQSKSISNNTVRSMTIDWNGNIWIATYGGGINLYESKKDIIHILNESEAEVKDASQLFLWTILRDRSDVIWIGTFGSGLLNYAKNKLNIRDLVTDKSINEILKSVRITAIIEDEKENIWLGTLGNGVYILDPTYKRINHFINNPEMPKNIVRTIYEDNSGRVWIGTDDGLYKVGIDRKDISFYTNDIENEKSISNNGVYTIYEDRKGNIWIGIWGKGINLLRKVEIKKVPEDAWFEKFSEQDLTGNNIWSIQESQSGDLLFGTNKGLIIYNPVKKNIEHISTFDISSLFRDSKGELWIGTFGNGALKYNQLAESFEVFNSERGLISDISFSFFSDTKNNIWISTNKGLTRYSPDKNIYQNYSIKRDVELTKIGIKALCKTSDGLVIIGGEGGLKFFNPDLIFENFESYPLYITDIKLFNKSIRNLDKQFTDIPSLKELTLSYKQNFISIEFAALNYTEPEKIKYAYKLEGFDEDWVYTSATNRIATYKSLMGGDYLFSVRSLNTNGMWNNNEVKLKIIVKPPFWGTKIFKISTGLLLLVILILIIRFREKRIHKDYQLKEELLRSEKLLIENEELKRQKEQFEDKLVEKKNELTSTAAHIVGKNQALAVIRAELDKLLLNALPVTRRKLEKVIFQINMNLNDESNWEKLNLNLNLIQDNFLSRFAEKFREITHKDLKICAYIRMNLSNEEISELLNISRRGLEMSRYRIRKKIGMDKKIQLNDFILRF